jgi:hypothetical protein
MSTIDHEKISAVIENIHSLKEESQATNETKQNIREAIDLMPDIIQCYVTEDKKFEFYRVTKVSSLSSAEESKRVQTFSYPPKDKCDMARANIEKHPVLYVASNISTAIKESMCEEGNEVFLTKWTLNKAENVNICSLLSEYKDNTKTNIIKENPDNFIKENKQEKNSRQETSIIKKELTKLFLEDSYEASSKIGHYLLYEHKQAQVDIIMYPSTANKEQYYNYAISPDFTDKHVILQEIKRGKVKKTKQGEFEFISLSEGRIEGDKIKWQ